MAISSMVVECKAGSSEAVLRSLALFEHVTVYGIKDNQIITVMESEDLTVMERIMKELYTIEGVVGVFPVYAGGYEE